MALARASVALRGVRRPVAASASQSCVGWSDGGRRHYNKPFKSYWEYKPMDNRPLETWEEVEMNRPRNPSVNEGYARPTKAPTQFELTREQFHQFMRGTPKAFSPRLKGNLTAIGLVMFMAFEMAFTFYQMRPDDFEWVEDERKRLEAARKKLDRILAEQAKQQAEAKAELESSDAAAAAVTGGR